MAEKSSDMALLVIHISNEERLNAGETEDFLLVPFKHYIHAVKIVKDLQEFKKTRVVNTITAVKNHLDEAKISYEHVEEGTRVYLGNVEESSEEE